MAEKSKSNSRFSLTQRVHRAYPSLPEGEKKVADIILSRPGDLAVWTASELATLTGVSNATVSRLFRRLEYSSFEEARLASRQLRAQGSPLYLYEDHDTTISRPKFLSDQVRSETALVEASLTELNPVTVKEVAERLATAKRVRFAGFRNSRILAEYGCATLRPFRNDVELMNYSTETLADGIAGLGAKDVAFIVGLRRRPAFFTDFVKAVASTGADIILISDYSIREAPAHAKWNVSCGVETPQLVDSYLGVMAVIRALSLATINRLGTEGRKYLTEIERLHENMSELE